MVIAKRTYQNYVFHSLDPINITQIHTYKQWLKGYGRITNF